MKARKVTPKSVIIIFFAIIFAIQLITAIGYGDYLDRSSELEIVYSNIKEYADRIAGENCRIVSLMDERGIDKITEYVERDHGVSTHYLMGGLMFVDEYNMYLSNVIWYMYTSFIFFCGLVSLYLLCRRLQFNRYVSCFAVLMTWLNPRFFAESHYNNKDLVLLALLFALFYWGHRFVTENRWSDCVVFAITGAFAANIKIIGIWAFGIIGLYYLFYLILRKEMNCKKFFKGVTCIVVWAGMYLLLTPGSWNGIVDFVKYNISYAVNFSRWDDYILFQGRLVSAKYTGIPRKYLPVMILITTPVCILLMIAWGYIQVFIDIISRKRRIILGEKSYLLVLISVGIIPLVYAVLAATPVYNGWRHFYFSYASMIIAGAYGCDSVFNHMREGWRQICLVGGGILYAVVTAVGIGSNYPHEHSFYNILAGENVEQKFELDYWEVSFRQALEEISRSHSKKIAKVSGINVVTRWGIEGNYDTLNPEIADRMVMVENWEEADYVIVNPSYAIMYNEGQYEYLMREYQLTYRIQSYGNTVCEVYCR